MSAPMPPGLRPLTRQCMKHPQSAATHSVHIFINGEQTQQLHVCSHCVRAFEIQIAAGGFERAGAQYGVAMRARIFEMGATSQ